MAQIIASTSRRSRFITGAFQVCRARHLALDACDSSSHSLRLQLHDRPLQTFLKPTPSLSESRPRHGQYSMRMMAAAGSQKYHECLSIAKDMKASGIQPDNVTYHALLRSAAHEGVWLDAWAIFDDMVSVGLKPDITAFNYLLHAQRYRSSPYSWKVFEKMHEFGVQPDSMAFTHLIDRYVADDNIEAAMQHFITAKHRNLTPGLEVTQQLIILATKKGHPRLAIELATWFEENSVRKIDHLTWLYCLLSSAESLYADGVTKCWKVVLDSFRIIPDQGTCMAVLHTAARHGLPELAADVLRVLELSDTSLREHHFAALIEACARGQQLKSAFVALHAMQNNGTEPLRTTTLPIFEAISKDLNTLDATWTILDELHKSGTPIGVAALNVVLQAAVSLGDLQRAVGAYKSYPEYGVSPDTNTFNLLLESCTTARHRQLGDILLAEMKESKIKPNSETYRAMVHLCLTQDVYEDAFFYLEEMKATHFAPSADIYEAVITKCLFAGDARYMVALKELEEAGHTPSSELKALLKSTGLQKKGVNIT